MSTLRKNERLSSQKEISYLVKQGNTFSCYPFRILWSISPNAQVSTFQLQAAFSVPKKKFKKAVQRNTIRRRMKEAFRLNKEPFKKDMKEQPLKLSLLIIFTPVYELDYEKIENGIKKTFQILNKQITDKTQ